MTLRYQDIYRLDANPPYYQDVYHLSGAEAISWLDVYELNAGDPTPVAKHPLEGNYRFYRSHWEEIYNPRGRRFENVQVWTPAAYSGPVAIDGLESARQLLPAGEGITAEQLKQVLQTDAACDAIEFIQRYPAPPGGGRERSWVSILGNGTNGTANLVHSNLAYHIGWARGQIGRLYWVIIGSDFNSRAGRTNNWVSRFGVRALEADAPPSWWNAPQIGVPSRFTEGASHYDDNLLLWTWSDPGGGQSPWYDCDGVYHLPPHFRDIYILDAPLAGWQDVYDLPADLAIWHDVYRLDANPETWQDIYQLPVADFTGYQDVYKLDAPITRGLTGYQDIYELDAPLAAVPRWQDIYLLDADIPAPVRWQDVYALEAFIGETVVTITAPDGTRLIASGDWRRGSARLGRNNASHLSKVLPLQMQLVFDNSDGRYDPGKVAVGHRINWNIFGHLAASGFVSRIDTQVNHRTGLHEAIVHCQGALAQLNLDDYELSLFITETVRTGEVLNDVLDQAGWPANARMIDRGQVRLSPAHYVGVLNSRQIHRAGPSLRAMEEAEIGLLHEGRGNIVAFEERFSRELDNAAPKHVFGSVGDKAIWALRQTDAQESWDNVYTVVQVGAERALVQSERDIWRLPEPVQVYKDISWVLDLADFDERSGLQNNAVRSVVQWSPLRSEDYSGVEVRLSDFTRTSVRITALADGTLTRLVLRGRGIALYGDAAIVERNDPDSVKQYGRRVLRLPRTFVGDGYNTGGDFVAEAHAHADLLLYRYGQPPIVGVLPVSLNHFPDLLRDIGISQRLSVDSTTGLPAGIYRCEGWDVHGDAETGLAEMLIRVSREVPREVIVDRALSFTPAGTDWQNVSSQTALGENPHVLAVDVHWPQGIVPKADEREVEVLRLVVDGDVLRSWTAQDVPTDLVGHPLAALVNEDVGAGAVFQARRVAGLRVNVDRLRVVSLATPVRPR